MKKELRARFNKDGTFTLRDGRRIVAQIDSGVAAFGGTPLVEELRWAAVRAGYPLISKNEAHELIGSALAERKQ